MPSRWLRWIIILFWLATTNWLFWHDLWPKWQPGKGPLLRPDDVDEVRNNTGRNTIFWTVLRQRGEETEPIFRAMTWVEYQPDEDAYTLNATLETSAAQKMQKVYLGRAFKIESIASLYQVDRAGQLHALHSLVKVMPEFGQLAPDLKKLIGSLLPSRSDPETKNNPLADQVSLRLWGEVRGEQFFAHFRATGDILAKPVQFDLPPTSMAHTSSVLMPLHPLNHIRGLYFGQSWRQPLVDPLRDAFASLTGFAGDVRWLHAHVLDRAQTLTVANNELSCRVIEYTNDEDETVARTWVEVESERVLQQEAVLDDGLWIMKREVERANSRRSPGS